MSEKTPLSHYLSPRGAEVMRAELKDLAQKERPRIVEIVSWAAGNGDRSENADYQYGKRRLREIDRRLRFLGKRLENAVIVDPAAQTTRDRVFFGATVTYVDEDDVEHTVTILGVDESDLVRGEVSLISPIARALMRTRVGDVAMLQTPRGPVEIEILKITYPEPQGLKEGVVQSEPRVGCGAAILVDGKLLLIRRKKAPEAGCWGLPGGKVDLFEPVSRAVEREVAEELGITIHARDMLCLVEQSDRESGTHWIAPVYLVTKLTGTPTLMEPEKHSDFGWFPLGELPSPLTTPTVQAMAALRSRADIF